MTFADRMEALRNSVPGCRLAAFGDARTRLMLRASCESGTRREVLDRLCDEASECFELGQTASDGGATAGEAIVLTPKEMRIFVQCPENKSDFLCLVCDLDCEPDELTRIGRKALADLTEVG